MRWLILAILLSGCAGREPVPPVRFGPDPYAVECRNGEVWIVSKHSAGPIGAACGVK